MLCGVACVNLKNSYIKKLRIHLSHKSRLKNYEKYTKYIIKIEKLLKLWRMPHLIIEGKISILKTLAISKVAHIFL